MVTPLRLTLWLTLLGAAMAVPNRAGVGQWTGGGPEGGEVIQVHRVAAPGPGAYIRTLTNGAWRMDRSGRGWERANGGLPALVADLAVSRYGDVLYAVEQGEVRVWVSTDGGASWRPTETAHPGLDRIHGVATSRTDSDLVLTAGRTGETTKIHRSSDGGATWQLVAEPNARPGLLEPDPANPDAFFLFPINGGTWRSTDRGSSWNHLPLNVGQPLFAASEEREGHFLAISQVSGLYESLDAGATWDLASVLPVGSQARVTALAWDPTDRSRIAVDYWIEGVFLTEDGGETWQPLGRPTLGRTRSLAFLPTSDRSSLLATTTEGVRLWSSSQRAWSRLDRGLRSRSPLSVSSFLLARGPATFVADWRMGPWRSVNLGRSWREPMTPWSGVVFDAMTMYEDTLYLLNGSILTSKNGGRSWKPVDSELPSTFYSAIEPSADGGLLIGLAALEQEGTAALYRSHDGGITGEPLFVPPGQSLLVYEPQKIGVHPARPSRILLASWRYQGGGCVVDKTDDGGRSWERPLILPPSQFCRHVSLSIDPAAPDILYLIARPGAPNDQVDTDFDRLLRSTDGGDTWQDIGADLPCYRSVAVHPETSDVFVGCDHLYVSHDRGVTWEIFDETGLPTDVRFIGALEATGQGGRAVLHAGTNAGTYSYTFPDR